MSKAILLSIICAAALWAQSNPLVGEWHMSSMKFVFTEEGMAYQYLADGELSDSTAYIFIAPDSMSFVADNDTLPVVCSKDSLVIDGTVLYSKEVFDSQKEVGSVNATELVGTWKQQSDDPDEKLMLRFYESDSCEILFPATYDIKGNVMTIDGDDSTDLEFRNDSLFMIDSDETIVLTRIGGETKKKKRSRKVKVSKYSKAICGAWIGESEGMEMTFRFNEDKTLEAGMGTKYDVRKSAIWFEFMGFEREFTLENDKLTLDGSDVFTRVQ